MKQKTLMPEEFELLHNDEALHLIGAVGANDGLESESSNHLDRSNHHDRSEHNDNSDHSDHSDYADHSTAYDLARTAFMEF